MLARPHCLLLVAALAAPAVTPCGSAASTTSPAPAAPCRGAQLSGRFKVVPGSAGAGNIVYALRLTNRSGRTCFVSGLAGLRLLDSRGRPLPTKVEPAFRPGLTAVKVILRRGGTARVDARFSPDVPGPGEPVAGRRCEPVAYRVRVTPPPGGGTLVAPITPPTSVCVSGQISLRALSPA